MTTSSTHGENTREAKELICHADAMLTRETRDHVQYASENTREAKEQYAMLTREAKELIRHADGNGICKIEFGPI